MLWFAASSTALVILGLSCWICEFVVKFFAVCAFVNLGPHYFGVCEYAMKLFLGGCEFVIR